MAANASVESYTEGNQIVQARIFQAPRELVWKAFTEPGQIAQWWGPVGFTTTNHEMDVRVGGAWRFTMHGWGNDFPNRIDYDEVVPNERLAYRHGDGEREHFRVVVTFERAGEGTKVTMRSTFPSEEAVAQVVKDVKALEGGAQTLARLDLHVAAQRGGAVAAADGDRAMVFRRSFDAPRKLVWETWTKAEHLERWFGPYPFSVRVLAMDLRQGGRWRFMMCNPDGSDLHAFGGEFREIVPLERLVMTDAFEQPGAPVMLWTVTFAEQGGKTALTVRVEFESAAVRDEYMGMGMKEGLLQTLNQIVDVLATIA